MRRYEAVIWDWNGTLLDDVDLCLEIANELLSEYGLGAMSNERYRHIFDFPVRLYWERAGMDFERVDFSALSIRFCALFDERLRAAALFDNAAATLAAVRGAGARQFLLSNTEHDTLCRMARHYAIAGEFDAVHGMSNTFATGKLGGGQQLVERFGLSLSDTVMIGDTAHDAEVAAQLGIDCILVATGHHAPTRLADVGCEVVDSLDALPAEWFGR